MRVLRSSALAALVLVALGAVAGRALQAPQQPGPVAVPEGPRVAPYKPDLPIAIVVGLLIDATGAPPRLDQTVLIVGERIAEIGPMEQVPTPSGAHVIDASGMTVMPGLMDSNQHIVLNPMYSTPDISLPLDQFRKRWEDTWSRMEREAYTFLMQGITGFRQTPGPADRILARVYQVSPAAGDNRLSARQLSESTGMTYGCRNRSSFSAAANCRCRGVRRL